MPVFRSRAAEIHYQDAGKGFPLLLLAPGGMNSTIEFWDRAPFNPLQAYADDFRLVALDQRNAGQSYGRLDTENPWRAYTDDQLGLLDHLGIESFHVLGCCVGCSYALKLIERAPERVAAAVLAQPIGVDDGNREPVETMWRTWGRELTERRDDVTQDEVDAFCTEMWRQNDFVPGVSREFVRSCQTQLLVMPGVDEFHPERIGRELATLAPRAELRIPWRDTTERIEETVEHVRVFLKEHTPS